MMFWIVDEEGREYGCFRTKDEAERRIEDLYTYTSKDVLLGIEEEGEK